MSHMHNKTRRCLTRKSSTAYALRKTIFLFTNRPYATFVYGGGKIEHSNCCHHFACKGTTKKWHTQVCTSFFTKAPFPLLRSFPRLTGDIMLQNYNKKTTYAREKRKISAEDLLISKIKRERWSILTTFKPLEFEGESKCFSTLIWHFCAKGNLYSSSIDVSPDKPLADPKRDNCRMARS